MHAVISNSDPVRFETRREAEQYVTTALGCDGYDVEAIAAECFAFDEARQADGTIRLDRQCLRLSVTGPEFWASAARNEVQS